MAPMKEIVSTDADAEGRSQAQSMLSFVPTARRCSVLQHVAIARCNSNGQTRL
jgi:hypothetical protein